jgi:hypothetical protein
MLLDIEEFKISNKKEFVHEVGKKKEINEYFDKIND